MSKGKAPSFQFYPKDLLADGNVILMSTEEVGMYMLLMSVCWLEGYLPDDEKDLAKIARVTPKKFKKSWESRIKRCFKKNEKSEWIHPRLEEEREKQKEFKNTKSASGLKGAEKRWGKNSTAKKTTQEEGGKNIAAPENENGSAIDSPMAKNASSSPSSTPVKEKNPSGSKRMFTPPSLEEVIHYLVQEREYPPKLAAVVGEMFWSSYEMKNWKVGKAKMEKWKVALGRAISDNESGWDTIKREKEKYYGKTKTASGREGDFGDRYREQLREASTDFIT